MSTTFWAIITRHETHPAGRWTLGNALGGHCYETKAEAIAAARAAWDGTGVTWRLVSIPGDDEQDGSRLREAAQTRGNTE